MRDRAAGNGAVCPSGGPKMASRCGGSANEGGKTGIEMGLYETGPNGNAGWPLCCFRLLRALGLLPGGELLLDLRCYGVGVHLVGLGGVA